MKFRLAALITAVLTCVSVVVGIGLTATAAYAQQTEICGTAPGYVPSFPCLNAWNGGPDLNTYTPGASDEDFQLEVVDRSGVYYDQIEYLPYDTCVGDGDGGSSTDARAVMTDACNGANGYGGSYGTLFLLEDDSCPLGYKFFNVHWGGLLSYSGVPEGGDGDAFYLNTALSYCMGQF